MSSYVCVVAFIHGADAVCFLLSGAMSPFAGTRLASSIESIAASNTCARPHPLVNSLATAVGSSARCLMAAVALSRPDAAEPSTSVVDTLNGSWSEGACVPQAPHAGSQMLATITTLRCALVREYAHETCSVTMCRCTALAALHVRRYLAGCKNLGRGKYKHEAQLTRYTSHGSLRSVSVNPRRVHCIACMRAGGRRRRGALA